MAGYVAALRAAGRSPGTVRLRRYWLSRLVEVVPRSPWAVTSLDLQRFLSVESWAPETRKSARSCVRGFYSWALDAGHVDVDPAARLGPVRVPPGLPRPAPEEVVRGAIAACDARTGLMVRLAAFAGLRAAEISRVHSRDLVGDVLRVHGKGGKVRDVPILNAELLAELQRLVGYAFPNRHGDPMTAGHVTRLVSRSLPDGWTAHTLRHRMGTRAYAGTRDLLAVQQLLGHSRPETTQRYVRLPDDALRAAIVHVEQLQAAVRVVPRVGDVSTMMCPTWCAFHDEDFADNTWAHALTLLEVDGLTIQLAYLGQADGGPGDGVVYLEIATPSEGINMPATPDLLRAFGGVVNGAAVL